MSTVREYAGRHEYDGRVEDLSPEGVRAGLARLGGPPEGRSRAAREAHLAAFERLVRLELGELELHRSNPLYHIGALDVSCYDRDYAPAAERAEARRRHLAAWPDAVDAAVAALDRVAAPVAEALLPAAQGLTADLAPEAEDPVVERALAPTSAWSPTWRRPPPTATRTPPSAGGRWSGCSAPARPSRSTWAGWRSGPTPSGTGCGPCWTSLRRLEPGGPPPRWWTGCCDDHPDTGGVLREAQAMTAESIAFTLERDLVPGLDGECLVAPAPPRAAGPWP
jgi:hypothetical protein